MRFERSVLAPLRRALQTPKARTGINLCLCVLAPAGCSLLSAILPRDLQSFALFASLMTAPLLAWLGGRLMGLATGVIALGFLLYPRLDLRLDWLSTGGAGWDDLLVFATLAAVFVELVLAHKRLLGRLNAEVERTAALAADREVLLLEVQHRTGNNLQTISTALALQALEADDPIAERSLKKAALRVASCAKVQRNLAGELGQNLSFSDVISEVVTEMSTAYDVHIRFTSVKNSDGGEVAMAAPLATIAQELIANAVEHGGRPGGDPSVQVTLGPEAPGWARLIVTDNGPGLPSNFRPGGSLGLRLVASLTRQLGGVFTVENRETRQGVVASVRWPIAAAGHGRRNAERRSANPPRSRAQRTAA